MSDRTAVTWRLLVPVIGFVLGTVLAPRLSSPQKRAEYFPLPHHVPKHPGGLSFRFVMAHDVLHERYPKHGPAHYQERNRLTREKLAKLSPDDPATFPLTDDLAAGLARLGQLDEAITLLRAKLARQQAKGMTGRDLYTSYANLGAILFHAKLNDATAGAPAARGQVREGVEMVRKSVAVNPEAHFGREQWQVAYAEFLLAAMDEPDVLRRFDFIGNRLDQTPPVPRQHPELLDPEYGQVYHSYYRNAGDASRIVSRLVGENVRSDPETWEMKARRVRRYITHVGDEIDWDDLCETSLRQPVAFDEPCLGIVGMWRQGIGPDPHFALCLGEIMLRVGQRFIAWAAFERAARLADKFRPDPATQLFLRDHCKKRQTEIAATMTAHDAAELRQRFDAELAYGESYQRDYQQYEAAKIAAGLPITDEHFFDDFHKGREPIASPSGPEEWYAISGEYSQLLVARFWAIVSAVGWGLFGAGFATAVMVWGSRRTGRATQETV